MNKIEHLVNQEPFFETDVVYLNALAQHVLDLQVVARIANENARGRRSGGCGCHQCRARAERATQELAAAHEKFVNENHRQNTLHEDPEINVKPLELQDESGNS